MPLPRPVLEGVGLEQRLLELTPPLCAQVAQRRVAHDLLDAATELGARL